jgi:23S rRNA G2069 N7-methylase RlmK/C1962 C5-methylase RlmI
VIITYMQTPLYRYTFQNSRIRAWVEYNCSGLVLNLFAGVTKLDVNEIRNDLSMNALASYHKDALVFVNEWDGFKFDTIILDPPYSYRKSMEMYDGKVASPFNKLKDALCRIINDKGSVITFGYHSVSMGMKRGFVQDRILLMSHGGAIHDTIAVKEVKIDTTVRKVHHNES